MIRLIRPTSALRRTVVTSKTERATVRCTRMLTAGCHATGSTGSRMRVGVLGAGRIATTVHIPNILSNRRVDLSWIVEDNPAVAQSAMTALNITTPVHTSDQLPALLGDNSVEAVFVFTPVSTHYPLILDCLENGKAVFTEKPTAETVKQVEQLYDTAEKVGRPLFSAFNRRYDPAYSDIRRMLADGQLGKLRVAKITTRDSPKCSYEMLCDMSSSGCNLISEMGVHDFDFMTWIMDGEAPETVFSMTHAHDPVLAELFGSLGMAASENPRENFAVRNCEAGAMRTRMMHSFPERFRESFVAEVDQFIDCVEGKTTPLVTKEQCVLAALVKEAALESFRQKQAVDFKQFLAHGGAS